MATILLSMCVMLPVKMKLICPVRSFLEHKPDINMTSALIIKRTLKSAQLNFVTGGFGD